MVVRRRILPWRQPMSIYTDPIATNSAPCTRIGGQLNEFTPALPQSGVGDCVTAPCGSPHS